MLLCRLRTRSQAKALQSSSILSDRLERYWESLRLELFQSKELGLNTIASVHEKLEPSSFSVSDALNLYLKSKGGAEEKPLGTLAGSLYEAMHELNLVEVGADLS